MLNTGYRIRKPHTETRIPKPENRIPKFAETLNRTTWPSKDKKEEDKEGPYNL